MERSFFCNKNQCAAARSGSLLGRRECARLAIRCHARLDNASMTRIYSMTPPGRRP